MPVDGRKRLVSRTVAKDGQGGTRTTCEFAGETTLSDRGGAESGALLTLAPELAALVAAWPTLPDPIKSAIRALVGTVAPLHGGVR